MSFSKKVLRLLKSIFGGFVLLAIMGGSLALVPRKQWDMVTRYLPFTRTVARSSPTAPLAAAPDAQKRPDRATVKLNVTKQQLIGVQTSTVASMALEKTIRTVGKVAYDETRMTDVNLKIGGWIEKPFVDYTGKPVRKGQPLLTIYSPDLVSTQEEYLLAVQTLEKVRNSRLPDAVRGAKALVEASRRRLLLWDITEGQISRLARTGRPQTNLTIESPVSGFVVQKKIVEKMYVKPGMSLYRIADISTVWIEADIYESDLPFVKVGQRATITLPYGGGRVLQGRITFIYPFMDPATRTVKVRLSFPNPGARLKPEMYANVEIRNKGGKKLAVPESAVLHSGVRNLVFVDRGKGMFEPREVKLGPKMDGHYMVLKGLSAGEKVVTSANFLIDSESRLMAATGGMTGMMSLIGMGD
ncbi:MAG: efflux RND transporter periplasmic adaptor subunit, partial [Nitrospinota bacterium]